LQVTIEPEYWFIRKYYIGDIIISASQTGYFGRFLLLKKRSLKRLGKIGSFLIKELLKIKGISEVFITQKFLKIWLLRDYKWEDIDDKILKVLEEALEKAKDKDL